MSNFIAPPEALKKDVESMIEEVRLDTSDDTSLFLKIQSSAGHAQNGHTIHYNRPYPNTRMKDICLACNYDPKKIASARQNIIDKSEEWLFSKEKEQYPIDKDGKPLFGMNLFRDSDKLNMDQVRAGFILGAYMDSWDIRKIVNETFRTKIGGGKNYYFDKEIFDLIGYNMLHFGLEEHTDEDIEKFKNLGLVIDDPSQVEHPTLYYIRRKVGRGVSDDFAVISAMLKYGYDTGIGVYMADAVDTWDKYCSRPVLEGHDERIASRIQEEFPGLVTQKDILTFIKDAHSIPKTYDPDSSQRYFLQIDEKTNQSCIESHINFSMGEPYKKAIIGFNRRLNRNFYQHIKGSFDFSNYSPLGTD